MSSNDILETGGSEAPSFSIQVMSDLHLETPRLFPMYGQFHVQPASPYLALIGDIGSVYDGRLYQFLREQLQQFKVVFYVLGNHEPYWIGDDAGEDEQTPDRGYGDAARRMQAFADRIAAVNRDTHGTPLNTGRFVFMDRTRCDLTDTITVLGCTLFSHISDEQQTTAAMFVSDFSNIPGWSVAQHNAAHTRDLHWLNDEVEAIARSHPHRKIIILTHYSPTTAPEANDPKHLEDHRGVRTAFSTDLSREPCWTSPAVRLWAFGHTHFNCDFVDETTGKRVVANQRGYGREDIFDFDLDKTVVIE